MNQAAARSEWTCEWTFGARNETETDGEVFSTFSSTDLVGVKLRIKDLEGTSLAEISTPAPLKIVSDSWRWYALSREIHLELTRLVIVLFITLFGSMNVAQQNAQSLSFLGAIAAVVAIGFGADTVKAIIMRTDRTPKTP